MAILPPGLEAGEEKSPVSKQPSLRHMPQVPPQRQVSAEKWSQMAAELLRIEALRNPRLALECADKALEINPRFPFAYLNRGSAHMMLELPQEAIKDYSQAIRLAPQLSQAHFNRALAYEALGQYETAAADFTTVIALNPKDAEARVGRAAANFDLGKDGIACKDLQKACELGLCPPLEQARKKNLCPENNH